MATPLRSLIISLQARTDQFERQIQGATRQITELRATVEHSQSVISSLGSSLSSMGSSAIASYVSLQTLKAGLLGVVDAGVRMERLTVAFRQVAGSAEAGRKEFAFVSDTANRLGQNLETLASNYNSLSAASRGTKLEGQATKDIFLSVAQAGRSLQLSQEQMGGALNAIQQMMSKGTVYSEELRGQLGERLPGAFQIAARAMGVTTVELGKMLEKGSVMADVFLPRFAAQLRKEFGETTTEVTRTASENFARFGNAVTLVADNMAKNTGLLTWLGAVAGKLADIALESDKAAKHLDEIAKKGAAGTIQKSTQGVGAADTPANKRRLQELETIIRQIDSVEKALIQLRARAADPSFFGRVREFVDADLGRGRMLQGRLEDLQAKRTRIAGTVTRGTPPVPGEDIEAGVDESAFGRTQQAEKDRQKVNHEGLTKILQDLQDATTATGAWHTEAERVKKEIAAIEKALEAIRELRAKAGAAGAAGALGRAPATLMSKIHNAATAAGINPILFESLVAQESDFNPRALGTSGEKGLTQLMPGTAQALGVTDPYDVDQNLRGGATYLAQQLKTFGRTDLALAAYNAGPGSVRKAGGIPTSAASYVKSVTGRAERFGGGASPGGAEIDTVLADLEKRRKDLDQSVKTQEAFEKVDTLADKAWMEAIEGRAASMDKLQESLKGGTKELSAYETAQIRAKLASVQGFEANKGIIESLLTEIDIRRELTEAFKTEEAEYKALGELQEKQAKEQKERAEEEKKLNEEIAAARIDGLRRESEERKKQAEEFQKDAELAGRTLLDFGKDLVDALTKGGDAWEQFGSRVADTLLKIALEKSDFEEKLGGWLLQGVGMLFKLLGGGSGGLTLDTSAGVGDLGSIDMSGFLPRAHGGPVSAGHPYLVGERGPEIYIPATSGAIMNNSSAQSWNNAGGARNINVTIQVSGVQDAQSFVRSRAEVQRAAIQAMQAAQRSI